MCFEGKCLGCIKVETGSMIFAVFNAVVWAITVVGSLIGIIVIYFMNNSYNYQAKVGDINFRANSIDNFDIGVGDYHMSSRDNMSTRNAYYIVYVVCGSLIGVGLFHFLFAVLLCNGINKRNNSQIKAYFIYGIVMAIINSIAVLVLGSMESGFFLFVAPIVVYGFILHMIKLTMDKFSTGQVLGFQHKRLVEQFGPTP
ncbi:unnamed protein product [Diatraea saccharalis]|uniref:Uncharacterized protein n=1 Tax=Diatraea saccharalis TaxID=40085 RepID=A0A9P0FZT3_9NEOP|nr:unnamed protein product [Diatraea saccharalis]